MGTLGQRKRVEITSPKYFSPREVRVEKGSHSQASVTSVKNPSARSKGGASEVHSTQIEKLCPILRAHTVIKTRGAPVLEKQRQAHPWGSLPVKAN